VPADLAVVMREPRSNGRSDRCHNA
jgi:hypothetical protein